MFKRHLNATIVWVHTCTGRIVCPVKNHAATIEAPLTDRAFDHLYLEISWHEVAKYLGSSPEATRVTADLMNRYPDRFLLAPTKSRPRLRKST